MNLSVDQMDSLRLWLFMMFIMISPAVIIYIGEKLKEKKKYVRIIRCAVRNMYTRISNQHKKGNSQRYYDVYAITRNTRDHHES